MGTNAGRWATIALAAAIAAGCAETKPAGTAARPDTEIRITKVERLGWNAPPEPDLFRVEFGVELTREMRRRAGAQAHTPVTDGYRAEFDQMEEEANREFLARGLCAHGAKFADVVQGAGERGPNLVAYFRCRPRPLL
jgi:hypothetical protein